MFVEHAVASSTADTSELIQITNARPEHAGAICAILHAIYPGFALEEYMPADCIAAHIRRFPVGQFVALHAAEVVGFALTLRTQHTPGDPPQNWLAAIGGYALQNHHPQGEWLYGIDFAVKPEYRRHGIGTRLYQARFALVRRLDLRGFYAGGLLAGYSRYMAVLSIEEYADRVRRGELEDATVTMQMRRGFRAVQLIPDYSSDPPPMRAAMLIVWDNPAYLPPVAPPVPAAAVLREPAAAAV